MSQSVSSLVRQFCMIQLQVLKDKEKKLRKEILDSKMQREFLESMLVKIEEGKNDNTFTSLGINYCHFYPLLS